ncbi:O-antigen ligase family protein [Holdemania massiliensis]|uniref:O-antigen ligase family protein n=1 Tax=Holdemania massiliensis TaxID=1468449 RepID=UPI001F05A357|nr:O-antigen ligase family protein [Holdemania massiliensis]MCH1940706.1 O-antigen ligase family protein [Holdemania massiliensis]
MADEVAVKNRNIVSVSLGKITIVYAITLSIMIAVRDLGGINMSKYLFVVVCTGFFMYARKSEMISMIAFTAPLLYGLPGNYIIPIILAIYFIKSRNINSKQFVLCVFIAFMEIIASMFYDSFSIPGIIGYMTNLMLFFCLIYDWTEYDYIKTLNYFVCGVVLTSLIIVLSTILKSPTWLQDIANGYFRFGVVEHVNEDALNLTLNANALAYYSISGISCIAVLLKCSVYNKLLLIAEMIFLALTGVMTLSRTWMIVGSLLLVLYIFSSNRSMKDVAKALLIIGSIAIVAFVVMGQLPEVYEGLIARFNRADTATANGRFDITEEYIEKFNSDLRIMLFGTGVTEYRSVMGITKSLHNSLVQILVCYGIIGGMVFMFGWLSNVIKMIGRVKLLYWIPFICIFAYSITAQIVNPHNLIYPHMMAIFAIRLGLDAKSERGAL